MLKIMNVIYVFYILSALHRPYLFHLQNYANVKVILLLLLLGPYSNDNFQREALKKINVLLLHSLQRNFDMLKIKKIYKKKKRGLSPLISVLMIVILVRSTAQRGFSWIFSRILSEIRFTRPRFTERSH